MDIVSLKINSPELCILHCLPRMRLLLKRDLRPPCPMGGPDAVRFASVLLFGCFEGVGIVGRVSRELN